MHTIVNKKPVLHNKHNLLDLDYVVHAIRPGPFILYWNNPGFWSLGDLFCNSCLVLDWT